MKVSNIKQTLVLLVLLVAQQIFAQAADYDDEDGNEDSRRIHRRRRPQQPYLAGGGPCGRNLDGDGRFLSLNYVNVNYHVNCGGGYGGGGGGYYPGGGPAAVYGGGFGGGGQKPHRPQRPQKPGLLGGHHQGGILGSHQQGGGILGSHQGGILGSHQQGGGILGSHLQGGGLFGSHGGGQGGLFGGSGGFFGGNRPQAIIQDITSGVGDLLNRPVPNLGLGGGGNTGSGLLGFGLFDGSILNSFTSLFTNSNRPSSTTNPPSTDVQYVQDNINNNVDNSIVEEKPVHEEHDELEEAYSNKLKRNRYVSAGPPYGGQYGGYNYNRVVNKVNREINQAIRPLYQLFRR